MSPLVIVFSVLLFFIPLYPKFPLTAVEGTYVAVRVEDWVVLLVLLIWGFWQAKNRFPILKQRIFKLFLIYWLIGLVSLFSAWWITDLISFKISFLHLLRRIEYMSLFFVAFDALRIMSLGEFAGVLGLTSILVFLYGMGQKYLGLPVVSTMNEEFSKGILLYLDRWTRISSTFSGHYDLAAWLVMLLALLPALIVAFKNKLAKIGLFIVGGLSFYLLILTASRVSFMAYLGGISVTLLLMKKFRWLPVVLAVSFFFGFQSKELNLRLASTFNFIPVTGQKIALLLGRQPERLPTPTPLAAPPTPTPTPVSVAVKEKPKVVAKKKILKEVRTWPKPEEIAAAAARSSRIRFEVEWPRAQRAFLKNPLLGTGYSSLGLATDNDYLRTLGETGFLGFLAFVLIIFHLARKGLEALLVKKQILMAGFLGLLAGFLANAAFIDVFEASKDAFYFWMMMGAMYQLSSKVRS